MVSTGMRVSRMWKISKLEHSLHVICFKHGYRVIRANISCCQKRDKTVTSARSCSLSSTNRAENNVQTSVNFCSSKGKGQSIPHQITHVQICHKILRPHRTVHLVHGITMDIQYLPHQSYATLSIR